MPVTITLSDELATLLEAQAATRDISVEQLALSILGDAAQCPRESQTWALLNQRRFALISRLYSSGLTEDEEQELTRLQSTLAGLLEPWDNALADKLSLYEARATRLPPGSMHD